MSKIVIKELSSARKLRKKSRENEPGKSLIFSPEAWRNQLTSACQSDTSLVKPNLIKKILAFLVKKLKVNCVSRFFVCPVFSLVGNLRLDRGPHNSTQRRSVYFIY